MSGAGWGWWAGRDEEWLTIGPCATREDAIEEAINDVGKGEGDFVVMEAVLQSPRGPDADTVIDDFLNALCEDTDLYSSEHNAPEWNLSKDGQKAATVELQAALDEWSAKWILPNITPPNMFAATRHSETIHNTVDPDMLPGGHDNPRGDL